MRSEANALDHDGSIASKPADTSGRRRFLLGSLAAGISLGAGMTGCGGGAWDDEARLRAVNATLDVPGIDLRFNDWLFARGLSYAANVSAYATRDLWSVGPNGRLAATRTGQSTILVSSSHALAENSPTSVVLMGSQSTGLSLVAIDEDARLPGGREAHLRLLHAWPGVGALDVHITSANQTLAGREPEWVLGSYGALSPFGVPTQVARLRITPRGQPGWVLFDNVATRFAAGQVLTLVVAPAPGLSRVAVAALPQDAPGYVLANVATA